jgi:hypothetical protein
MLRHRGRAVPGVAMTTARGRKCSATTAADKPCRAWAIHGSDPPLCSAHAGRNTGAGAPPGNTNRQAHGFYASTLSEAELADLVAFSDDLTLDDEIACARVILRRLMHHLDLDPDADRPPDVDDLHKLANLALSATRTIARLLRDQRAISGDAADGIAGAIGQALDELATEWGLDL